MKKIKKVYPPIETGFAIYNPDFGFYIGWHYRRGEMIEQHCKMKGSDWATCKMRGDRCLKVKMEQI